jgi:hypothetical protein
MNYYIITGYIYVILSILIITLICVRWSMFDSNNNIHSYFYINEYTTGIIKNIECNNNDIHNNEITKSFNLTICNYTLDYTINNIKISDTLYADKNKYKIGDKIRIFYQSSVLIVDLIIFYLLIIIIIILWFFLLIIIIFSNNFNKYLYICYPSIASILILLIINRYNDITIKIAHIKIIILLLILFILIFNYIIIIFY